MEFLENVVEGENEFFEWFYFLSLALVLAFGTITTTGTVLQTDKPVVSVVSCSMYPEYHRGDILVVQGQKFGDIETGDVIVYSVPDRADLSVNGEKHILEKNSPMYNSSTMTAAGEVKLIEVKPDLEAGQDGNVDDEVVLEVDGEVVKLEEGSSAEEVKVEKAVAMPIPVVHRVVEKQDSYLETKGDNNRKKLDFESDVRPFQIHGTAALRIPRLGIVKLLAMDLVGFQAGDPPGINSSYFCGRSGLR
ncbi:MAG: signal peptidase I [Candidatus Nanohalobium sp.]